MPIEIRELVIRATVDPGGEEAPSGSGKKAGKKAERAVEESVAQVLEILRRKKER